MSFSAVQPSKKKNLRIRNKAHKAPITTTMPLCTPYIVSLHALVKSLLELAISSGKNGSWARSIEKCSNREYLAAPCAARELYLAVAVNGKRDCPRT